MTDAVLHLVLGDIAAGVLRDAMAAGTTAVAPLLRFRDIYCLGPLTAFGTAGGAESRAAYWRQLRPDSPPTVAEFDEEEARYAQARNAAERGSLLLWTGAHSSSQLWLQRLCALLPEQPADVRVVEAVEAAETGSPGRRAMSQFEPHELGRLLAQARRLGDGEIAQLAQAWRHNTEIASGVRRWREGRISHHGDDCYDELLLAQCDDDWQPAEQAIGSALWACDEFLGDLFFAWRLRCLAHAGRLQWRGALADLTKAEVRLPNAGDVGHLRH